jgi:hypothetical protein
VEATWELVGLAMGQAAVQWTTTDERRILERVRERRATWGAAGRTIERLKNNALQLPHLGRGKIPDGSSRASASPISFFSLLRRRKSDSKKGNDLS